MSGIPGIPFSRPWLSGVAQVQLLQQRGLKVADPQAAEQFLSHLNYYRFSGYCLAFENGRHNFNGGTTFEDVVAARDCTGSDFLRTAGLLNPKNSNLAGFLMHRPESSIFSKASKTWQR
ncbi:MAG: Abi family protein [Planctomyces sp.]